MNNSTLFSKRVWAPCKDCPDRVIGCHSHCEKYAEYKRVNNEYNKSLREARLREDDYNGFRIGSLGKYK